MLKRAFIKTQLTKKYAGVVSWDLGGNLLMEAWGGTDIIRHHGEHSLVLFSFHLGLVHFSLRLAETKEPQKIGLAASKIAFPGRRFGHNLGFDIYHGQLTLSAQDHCKECFPGRCAKPIYNARMTSGSDFAAPLRAVCGQAGSKGAAFSDRFQQGRGSLSRAENHVGVGRQGCEMWEPPGSNLTLPSPLTCRPVMKWRRLHDKSSWIFFKMSPLTWFARKTGLDSRCENCERNITSLSRVVIRQGQQCRSMRPEQWPWIEQLAALVGEKPKMNYAMLKLWSSRYGDAERSHTRLCSRIKLWGASKGSPCKHASFRTSAPSSPGGPSKTWYTRDLFPGRGSREKCEQALMQDGRKLTAFSHLASASCQEKALAGRVMRTHHPLSYCARAVYLHSSSIGGSLSSLPWRGGALRGASWSRQRCSQWLVADGQSGLAQMVISLLCGLPLRQLTTLVALLPSALQSPKI